MNESEKKVPAVVIKRLPRYYRYLSELLNQGITRISSNALSEKMNVTASQIRQDFNYFGGFGQQGGPQGGEGPDMGGYQNAGSNGPQDDDVVDGDYREV